MSSCDPIFDVNAQIIRMVYGFPSDLQYNTIQYNTIQYNTIQYNTIQYNIGIYKAPFPKDAKRKNSTETQMNKYKNKYQKYNRTMQNRKRKVNMPMDISIISIEF